MASSTGWVRDQRRIACAACSRKASASRCSLAAPSSAKPSGSRPSRARLYRDGSSFRLVRSPVAPKITRSTGSSGWYPLCCAAAPAASSRIAGGLVAVRVSATSPAELPGLSKRLRPDCRSGSGERGRLEDVPLQAAEPKGQCQKQDAAYQRIGANQPDERQQPGARVDHQQDTEQYRSDPDQNQQPLVPDYPPKAHGRDELGHAGDDGPGGDEEEQDQCRDAGPDERQDACDDPRCPLQNDQPGAGHSPGDQR